MRTRWISCSIAAATLFLAGCGSRDEVVVTTDLPAAATHGGDVVVLGDARFEVVHEPSTGVVTLYQLRSDRTVVLADAPAVEVRGAADARPVTFVRVERGVWRASSPALRVALSPDVRLVARVDGRRFDEPLAGAASREATPEVTPASVPPTPTAAPPEPSPAPRDDALPPAEGAPKADRSEHMLSLEGGGTVKVVREGSVITVSASDADGKALEVEKALLVVGSKETLLLRADGAWSGTLETASPDATVKLVLTIDGKERAATFPSSWRGTTSSEPPAAPTPPPPAPEEKPPAREDDVRKSMRPDEGALAADEEPVNPPDPHPEPAGKPGPANPPGGTTDTNASEARIALEGSFLLAVPGTDARLEVVHDKSAGKLTVQPVRGHAAFLLDEAPVLFLASKEPAGAGKATLNRLEGKPVWWVIHTELKDRDILGKLRLVIGGKEHDVDLAGPHVVEPASGYVVLGAARADVDHDHVAGMMAVRAGSQLQSLTFVARAADGRTVPIVLTPVPGRPGHFRATHDLFRAERLDGRFTARVEGRDVEGTLQTTPRADAAPRPGAGAPASGSPSAPGAGAGR